MTDLILMMTMSMVSFENSIDELNVCFTDITDNKWGKKRKDFYGTGFVDKDWGGMREEEVEDAQLEEEDALTRQKQIDKSTAAIADIFDDDEEEEDGKETVEVSQRCVKVTNDVFRWKLLSSLVKLTQKRRTRKFQKF